MASLSALSLPAGTVITVSSSSSSSSAAVGAGSPCAACKFLRRRCQPDCLFAPYFPPDNPQKFMHVHRLFGTSNVTKLLNEVSPDQREDAVNSIAYEAYMRLRDPVYGCAGVISVLQQHLLQQQQELSRARYELCKYQAAAAVSPSVGRNGLPAVAGFIGSMVPHRTQNIININHSGQDRFAAVQMLDRSYDGETSTAARLVMNGRRRRGGVGKMAGYGTLGGGAFFKPGTGDRDDRPTAAQYTARSNR